MHAQAVSLSDQDIEDIAAYLQGAEPVKPGTPAPGKRRRSKWRPVSPVTARPVWVSTAPLDAETGGARGTA